MQINIAYLSKNSGLFKYSVKIIDISGKNAANPVKTYSS